MNKPTLSPATSVALRGLLMAEVTNSHTGSRTGFWRKRVSVATLLTVLGVGVFGGAGVAVAITAIQPILMPSATGGEGKAGPQTKFPTNTAGQSYGSAAGYSPYLPDLIKVTGVGLTGQSVDGYVYQVDIQQPMPTSPADAATVEQNWNEKYPNGKTVTMYKSDGKTVIGTWVEG